tara:strand:+ start:179 stop:370 length:192 start_codon:yes stop_codon:yes gene_type:complete
MLSRISVLLLIFSALFQSGCFITKIITVPMRVSGAVVSIIPVVGETAHDAIDKAAETVDKIPL